MSQTAYNTSKRPALIFLQKFYDDQIASPIYIIKPDISVKETVLKMYEGDLESENQVVEKIEYAYKSIEEPIGRLDLYTKVLTINSSHPYVANYRDSNNNLLPLESMVIAEVLMEMHLYEFSLDEEQVNQIIHKRDVTLRQLALSDKMGIPSAAMCLKDFLSKPTGLEEAVARALTVLGFEVTPIGGNGEPDGKAEACLGYSESGVKRSYTITYDAKSTAQKRISAGTAHLSGLKRHRTKYNADYSLEVAIDYQGATDADSAIAIESELQQVTMMTAKDLIKLLFLITPKQIGLDKLRELFETCYTPIKVHEWVEKSKKRRLIDLHIMI